MRFISLIPIRLKLFPAFYFVLISPELVVAGFSPGGGAVRVRHVLPPMEQPREQSR